MKPRKPASVGPQIGWMPESTNQPSTAATVVPKVKSVNRRPSGTRRSITQVTAGAPGCAEQRADPGGELVIFERPEPPALGSKNSAMASPGAAREPSKQRARTGEPERDRDDAKRCTKDEVLHGEFRTPLRRPSFQPLANSLSTRFAQRRSTTSRSRSRTLNSPVPCRLRSRTTRRHATAGTIPAIAQSGSERYSSVST